MLRRIAICGMCLASLFLATSCNPSVQRNTAFDESIPVFPENMVGLWQAKTGTGPGQQWLIKFEKDGSIRKIDHLIAGPLVITEGGRSGKGPDEGTGFVFVLGPCLKQFTPETGVLELEINIDYFEMILPQGTLTGRQKDTFIGEVSQDGQTWEVQWRSYGWLDEAQEPDIKDIDANPESLTFKKIDIESLKQPTKTNANTKN